MKGLIRIASLLVLAGSAAALGHGMIPRDVPIDRIIKNIDARLAANPNDAHAHYVLGRAHGLAFETKNNNIYAFERGENPEPASAGWQKNRWGGGAKAVPSAEELKTHLAEAIRHLNRAIELNPDDPAYHLALASVLESGIASAGTIDVHPLLPAADLRVADPWYGDSLKALGSDPGASQRLSEALRWTQRRRSEPSPRDGVVAALWKMTGEDDKGRREGARKLLAEDWNNQMTDEYFRAMSLALPDDGKTSEQPIWGSMEDYVAYEAATNYVNIVGARGALPDERVRLDVAKATVKAFNDLPRPNAITPIIFPTDAARSLGDLLGAGRTTRFDLDGSGRHLEWPWVNGTTGILVWDPDRTGAITSGRQLFGSVTWWFFFKNGYEALASLDDNGDTILSGPELRGLAVWVDGNGNGVSDPGEVTPVESFGVASISTVGASVEDGAPCNHEGMRGSAGWTRPTFDWVVTPVDRVRRHGRRAAAPVIALCAGLTLLTGARRAGRRQG
jgi:hypothetical protein